MCMGQAARHAWAVRATTPVGAAATTAKESCPVHPERPRLANQLRRGGSSGLVVPSMTPRDQGLPSARAVPVANETEIRWDEAGAFVRRRLGYELPASSHGQIDDLVQESLVRLLRAVRREPVENLEALMTEIARRTAIDCLRRRTRWSALLSPAELAIHEVPDSTARTDDLGDPVERLHFVVLEFFTVREARCRELAVAFFAEQDWKLVAEEQGRSHQAVRKQWSRCLELLRAAARSDPGLLMDWSRSA